MPTALAATQAATPGSQQIQIVRNIPPLIRDKFGTFPGIQANGTAIYNVPLGPTYWGFFLYFTKAAAAEMSQTEIATDVKAIRVTLNGETEWNLTPGELKIINDYIGTNRGITSQTGYIYIDLCEMFSRQRPMDCRQLAWGTANVDQLTIEIDLQSALAALVAIDLYPVYEQTSRNIGVFKRTLPYSQNYTGTGDYEIATLPKTPNTAWRRIHITPGGGTIAKASLVVNNINMVKTWPVSLNTAMDNFIGGYTNNSYFTIDFNEGSELGGYLPMSPGGKLVNDIRLTPNFSGAPGAFKVILASFAGFTSL